MAVRDKRAKPGRHQAGCKVCAHPEREQIEAEWCAWANTSELAKQYGLSRDSIYRHAAAFNLQERRARNLRAALERIIEQAEGVTVNAAAVVSAIQAYAKINSAGQWVDRTEQVNLNDLFARMSAQELETYAREGTLPDWFTSIVGASPSDSQDEETNEQLEQKQGETD
jgi:hypothetical protein